jgi:flagellar FliL protein
LKANAKMKADPKADAAPPKSSKKKLLVIIITAVLVLGLGGGGAWFATQGKSDDKAVKEKAHAAEPPVYVPLEQFTVNLQPENGDQYLQIAMTLQVPTIKDVDVIKNNMPKVRSRVLLLLSAKKASELSTVEGKAVLTKEIVANLKQPFADKGEPQVINDVLFTSFIIQ